MGEEGVREWVGSGERMPRSEGLLLRCVRALGFASILTVASVSGAGCFGEPDREDWPDGRPRIDTLTYLQQLPASTPAFEFLIDFTDTDGDLGEGTLLFRVDDGTPQEQSLSSLFSSQTPALALTSTEGELDVVVTLGASVPVGGTVKFGFRLKDGANRESNEPSATLKAVGGGN